MEMRVVENMTVARDGQGSRWRLQAKGDRRRRESKVRGEMH
jgi:hypothetical protein